MRTYGYSQTITSQLIAILILLEEHEEAKTLLEQNISNYPDNLYFKAQYVNLLTKLDINSALAEGEKYHKEYPDNFGFTNQLININLKINNPINALKIAEDFYRLYPSDSVLETIERIKLIIKKSYDPKLELNKLLKYYKNNGLTELDIVSTVIETIRDMDNKRIECEPKLVQNNVKTLETIEPEKPTIVELENDDNIILDNESLKFNPGKKYFYKNYFYIRRCMDEGDYESSLNVLTKDLETNPSNLVIINMITEIYLKINNFEALEKLAHEYIYSGFVVYSYCSYLLRMKPNGYEVKITNFIELALTYIPAAPKLLCQYIWALLPQKRYEEMVAIFERIFSIDPENPIRRLFNNLYADLKPYLSKNSIKELTV